MDSLLVELRRDGVRGVLLLEFDPGRKLRALSHGMGYALSYLDRELAPECRDVILRLAGRFKDMPRVAHSNADVLAQVQALAAETDPGTQVRLIRPVAPNQETAIWPVELRSDASPAQDQSIWPFDPELAGLRAGTRQLIKREWLTPQRAQHDAQWLESQGLRCRLWRGAETHHGVMLAARDPAVLDEAERLEPLTQGRGPAWAEAVRNMGTLLGYPPCCQEAFLRISRRQDLWLLAELLPPLRHRAASPLSLWINPLGLLSHAPCSLGCAPSLSLAKRLLGALEGQRAGFTAAWNRMARRLHLITRDGRCLALDARGELQDREPIEIIDAIELVPPAPGEPLDPIRPAPGLAQTLLRVDDDHLVSEAPGAFRAGLVADHRGP